MDSCGPSRLALSNRVVPYLSLSAVGGHFALVSLQRIVTRGLPPQTPAKKHDVGASPGALVLAVVLVTIVAVAVIAIDTQTFWTLSFDCAANNSSN